MTLNIAEANEFSWELHPGLNIIDYHLPIAAHMI